MQHDRLPKTDREAGGLRSICKAVDNYLEEFIPISKKYAVVCEKQLEDQVL